MEKRKRNKIIFSALVITLLFCLMMKPVLADEVYDTIYSVEYMQLPYGNGVDDDGDGVIDNMEEDDVGYGTIDLNDTRPVVYGWNDTFNTEYGNITLTDNGIAISSIYDQPWRIYSSDNSSVSPVNDTCYKFEVNAEWQYEYGDGNREGPRLVSEKYLPVLRYNLKLDPADIMNGAQQIWFRSPLAYDPDSYEGHILNIYRESDDQLVWSNMLEDSDPYTQWNAKYPQMRPDNSTTGVMSDYERVYYRLNLPFYSDVEYRFEEYVKIKNDNAVNDVVVYMAHGQDIADDGIQTTYVLFDSSSARMIPTEASWGMIIKVGIGLAGTEIPQPTTYTGNSYVYTQTLTGTINDVESVRVIIPLRMTAVLDDIEIDLYVMSGGSRTKVDPSKIDEISGSIVCDFNLNASNGEDPDTGEINYYQLKLEVDARLGESTATDDDYIFYSVYPSDGDAVIIENFGEVDRDLYLSNFAFHYEVIESDTPLGGVSNVVETTDLWWTGVLLVSLCTVLMFVSPALSFAVMMGGVITAVSVSITSGLLEGSAFGDFISNLDFTFLGGEVGSILQWINSGVVRIPGIIMGGIEVLAGGFVDIIVMVWEALVMIGDAIGYYAGIILGSIVEIIYFIAFLIVIWGWAKFLDIMKWVTLNRPEKALSSIDQGGRAVTRQATRFIPIISKTGGNLVKGTKKLNKGAKNMKRWYDKRKGGDN